MTYLKYTLIIIGFGILLRIYIKFMERKEIERWQPNDITNAENRSKLEKTNQRHIINSYQNLMKFTQELDLHEKWMKKKPGGVRQRKYLNGCKKDPWLNKEDYLFIREYFNMQKIKLEYKAQRAGIILRASTKLTKEEKRMNKDKEKEKALELLIKTNDIFQGYNLYTAAIAIGIYFSCQFRGHNISEAQREKLLELIKITANSKNPEQQIL